MSKLWDIGGRNKRKEPDTPLTISILKMFSMFSVIFTVVEVNVNEVVGITIETLPWRSEEQYYFNKGFTKITINEERLKKLPDLVKIRIGAEMSENTDLVTEMS